MHNRWQVIDSPGILDHPVEEMNTVEMQSICAFAHLDACVLFFVDLSESCGYPIEDQLSLLKGLKSLFKNRPIIMVYSKSDLMTFDKLSKDSQNVLNNFINEFKKVRTLQLSTHEQKNIGELKTLACELFTE